MDELEIKGKKYISSRRASELTGYAKDYVGQLARAEKIIGTRMGRAWYVEEASLLAHAKADGTENTENRIEGREESVEPREEVSAAPVHIRTPQVSSQFMSKAPPLPSALKSSMQSWAPATYSSDDAELVPKPLKENREYGIENKEEEEEATPIAIHSQVSPISEELESAVRIKILEERERHSVFDAPKAVFRIAEKSNVIKAKRKIDNGVLSLGALTAALAIFLFFSAGLFVSSEITFTGPAMDSTANVLTGSQYFKDVLAQFPVFASGFAALQGFVGTIFSSFGGFFSKGGEFLLSLFHSI